MEWTDESCVLTDIQLQLLLQGCGCTELYGLPLKCWEKEQTGLVYQLQSLVRKQLLLVFEDKLYIPEPLKSWLITAADSVSICCIRIDGKPPRSFCTYGDAENVVIMERYPYQENSVRIQGFRKTDFYEEVFYLLKECGIREYGKALPKELFSEGLEEFERSGGTVRQKSVPEKFSADVRSKYGGHIRRISAVRFRLEDYLILETKDKRELFPFQKEKLKELMELCDV